MLLVHTSFRTIRPVAEGPLGLIEALRDAVGPGGTLVMPSWSGDDDEPFDPKSSPASPSLGVVADMFWRLPGALRSNHVHAFAATGPAAGKITSDPLPLPPHIPQSPVGRVHDLDGQVLLIGVNHDAEFDAPPGGDPRRRSVPRAEALHRPARRSPNSDRLRRKRPLLRALFLRGRLAACIEPSVRGTRGARPCAAGTRSRHRRSCTRAPKSGPAPFSPSPECNVCRM